MGPRGMKNGKAYLQDQIRICSRVYTGARVFLFSAPFPSSPFSYNLPSVVTLHCTRLHLLCRRLVCVFALQVGAL